MFNVTLFFFFTFFLSARSPLHSSLSWERKQKIHTVNTFATLVASRYVELTLYFHLFRFSPMYSWLLFCTRVRVAIFGGFSPSDLDLSLNRNKIKFKLS